MNEDLNFEVKVLLSEIYKILNLPIVVTSLENNEDDVINEEN
jgi:hypothetical protein